MNVSLVKGLAVAVVVAVLASACGGGTENASVIESQAGVPDGPTESSLAPDEASSDSNASSDDATADDGLADDAGASVASGASMVSLPAGDSAAAILELAESMLGPTDDISDTINQLYPFPEVPTPAGAHIMGFFATPGTLLAQDEGSVSLSTSAIVKVDLDRLDAVEAFEAGLAPAGWVLESKFDELESSYGPQTKLQFVIAEDKIRHTLWVEVQSNEGLGVTTVALRYGVLNLGDPGDMIRARFFGWHGDVPLLDGGEIRTTKISARFGPGRSTLVIESEYQHDGPIAADSESLGDMIVADAEADGVEFERVQDYIRLPRDEFERFDITGSGDKQHVRGEVQVITPPFSGVEVVGEEKSTEPLPVSNASADEIQDVVSDIYGLTADVTSQMQRLGPFPDLPTADGADITFVAASVSTKGNDDQHDSARTTVRMFVNGEYDDVVVFYEAQLAALGFTVTGSRTRTEDEGLTKITDDEYEGAEAVGGSKPRLFLTVTDDVDDARTTVKVEYLQDVPVADELMQRWTGWYGDGLPPAGGEISTVGVATNGPSVLQDAVYYNVTVVYPDKSEVDLMAAIADSDFSLAEDEEPVDFEGNNNSTLEHPGFAGASIYPLLRGEKEVLVSLGAARALELG